MTVTMPPTAAPIEIVLARLASVVQTGKSSWRASCPIHHGEPPLAVTEARDRRVVFTCPEGCATASIAGAIGLEVTDLYPPAKPSANGSSPRAERAERTPRVLANLDAEQAVLSAMLIDTDAAKRAIAIVTPTMFFSDRHRILCRAMILLLETESVIDPVTLGNVLGATGELERAGGKDYIGYLMDAVPTAANVEYHAGIVREWWQRRQLLGTVEATASLLKEPGGDTRDVAEIARSVADAILPITLDADTADALPMAVAAIDASVVEPIVWVVEELLTAGEPAVFAGDGGSYKSTGAFHIAAAIAGGYSAFNRFPTRQSPTLILSAEDGRGVIQNRLEANVVGHGWDRERVLSNVHIIATHDAKLASPAWQQHIRAECERLQVGFVLFDPWADLISGEENSNSEQRPVIQFLRSIATLTHGAVVVNAHATKTREGQRQIDRVRGATALRDAARCVLFFESRDEGIALEHLKMSRSEKLPPFTITREIISTPESRAIWSSARFTFLTAHEAVLSRAESWILDQVTAKPGVLNSTDLRNDGAVAGIRGEDLGQALSKLQAHALIDYQLGPHKSKLWRPVQVDQVCDPDRNSSLPSDLGRSNLRPAQPAQPAQSASGRPQLAADTAATLSQPAHPFRGGRQAGGSRLPVGAPEGSAGPPGIVEIPEEFDVHPDDRGDA